MDRREFLKYIIANADYLIFGSFLSVYFLNLYYKNLISIEPYYIEINKIFIKQVKQYKQDSFDLGSKILIPRSRKILINNIIIDPTLKCWNNVCYVYEDVDLTRFSQLGKIYLIDAPFLIENGRAIVPFKLGQSNEIIEKIFQILSIGLKLDKSDIDKEYREFMKKYLTASNEEKKKIRQEIESISNDDFYNVIKRKRIIAAYNKI